MINIYIGPKLLDMGCQGELLHCQANVFHMPPCSAPGAGKYSDELRTAAHSFAVRPISYTSFITVQMAVA